MNRKSEIKELKIAFGGYWKSIHPGLQHTLVGDLTLSNQFEALVGVNEIGVYVPLAAVSWEITEDFTKFRFKIDTTKRFSDGSYLKAIDFKSSWEQSLKLESKSANSSLLDILYKVEGFEKFSETGSISGLKANSDDVLEIKFSSPFRMALEHLSGNRYSAYKEKVGKFIGTGAYVIEEIGEEVLKLKPNPFYENSPKSEILLTTVKADEVINSLSNGTLDVVAYVMGATISSDFNKVNNISTIVGQDALHRAVYTNNQLGKFFSNKEHRLALQYLMHKFIKSNPNYLGNPNFTKQDPQVYLPIQSGRLNDEEVVKIVDSGKKYVDAFIKAANANPLILMETHEFSLRPFFDSIGIKLSDKSRIVEKSELIDLIYRGDAADLIPGNFGVASGDPDGIYHKLGKSGAIASPMTKNKAVEEILEEGRALIQKEKIDLFYQKVNKKILEEVPLVHLGFNKTIALYRNDKVSTEQKVLRRNAGHLFIFQAK